jgi:hypothetical protein
MKSLISFIMILASLASCSPDFGSLQGGLPDGGGGGGTGASVGTGTGSQVDAGTYSQVGIGTGSQVGTGTATSTTTASATATSTPTSSATATGTNTVGSCSYPPSCITGGTTGYFGTTGPFCFITHDIITSWRFLNYSGRTVIVNEQTVTAGEALTALDGSYQFDVTSGLSAEAYITWTGTYQACP